MNTINIYTLTLNPCMDPQEVLLSNVVDEVFSNYKLNIDNKARMGEVKLFTYSPKDNKVYSDIADGFLAKVKAPAIIITNSLFDLAPYPHVGYGRMKYLLASDKVKALYFLNYNREHDVTAYMKFLDKVFKADSRGSREYFPKILAKYEPLECLIKELVEGEPPVLLSDIAEATGLHLSTIKRISKNAWRSSEKGVPLSKEQKDRIDRMIMSIREDILDRYHFKESPYVPLSQR